MEIHLSDQNAPGGSAAPSGPGSNSGFRPTAVAAVPLATIGESIGVVVPGAAASVAVTGISLNSRTVQPGDLYVALPGASRHGADFVSQAVEAGAAAVLTDDAGGRLLALGSDIAVPVLVVAEPRSVVGRLSRLIYRSQDADLPGPSMFGVTGTNGKTTTTYFINALLQAMGKKTGLIGTIEILAGGDPIPSLLTTPESTDVHALLALMRERGLDAASMEVSSHAVSFRRVDGVGKALIMGLFERMPDTDPMLDIDEEEGDEAGAELRDIDYAELSPMHRQRGERRLRLTRRRTEDQ
jgi:UDP-N-acetylmuramoyl-L-alanyl-D-glutamate--2,6-diaminopimelate ligase